MHFPTQYFFGNGFALAPFGFWLLPLLGWSLIWKGLALWRAGRNNQLYWFIVLLILNTAGLLPILYLALFQSKPKKPSKKSLPRRQAGQSK
jgi:uncharacterized protein DUF5652